MAVRPSSLRLSGAITVALLLVGCTQSPADHDETAKETVLSDVCGDIDYSSATSLLGIEAVEAAATGGEILGTEDVGTLLCGVDVPPPANTVFGFAVWNYVPANGGEEFIAGRKEIWGDLDYVYPLQGGEYGDIDESLLAEPEVEELAADSWDRVAVVSYSQAGTSARSWDPEGDGLVMFCSLQSDDLTIDFELRVGDEATEGPPETQLYTETLIGIADQVAEQLRD